MYYALAALATVYSTLAIILLITYYLLKHVYGIMGSTEIINRKFARTRKITAFEVYSYFSLAVWFVLALPWIDLFTVQWSSRFENDGLRSYFGWMTSGEATLYFAVVFFNILGAKASLTLAELAGLLRKGRVQMIPRGLFHVWMPERTAI
ncbi:MAG TPA: hypothetical protein VFQ60_01885 [Patescibacteria group bacterium]|nr:hypothetical protein [Patescibacteria group bacterium]